MASLEFHKWHRKNIDPQGSFQVDNFAKCWEDAIKLEEALKPSHNISRDAIALLRKVYEAAVDADSPEDQCVVDVMDEVHTFLDAQQHPC